MDFKYRLDEKLRPLPLLMYGLQWLLIAVPVVLTSAVVARIQFPGAPAEQMFYTQKLFALIGAGLVAQTFAGHRMPMIMGPASVLLIGVLTAGAASVEAVYSSILAGGALLTLIAFTPLLRRLQFLFTPRISIVILSLISLTLAGFIIDLVFDRAPGADGLPAVRTPYPLFALGFALAVCVAMAAANHLLRGVWKSLVVPLAMGVGTAVYCAVCGWPEVTASSDGATQGWLLARFELDAGVLLSFLFCYAVLLINDLGSVQAVAGYLGVPDADERSRRSVGITGLFNMLGGAAGVLGPVNYTLSPGVISATGCASRHALVPAGVGLLLCALWPWLIGALSAIPSTVMGAVLLYLMATQLAAGMQMVAGMRAVQSFNDGLTVGLPLMTAVFLTFLPAEVKAQIPVLVQPVVGNAFVMGVLTVLLLEHVVFRSRRTR